MEDRDDYPIIPQPDPKTDEFRLQNYRAMENKLLSVNSDVKHLKDKLASLKEENAKLKEVVKELLQVVNLDEMEEEECNYWRPIIALAKRISDNK